jgi:hypothetical protein
MKKILIIVSFVLVLGLSGCMDHIEDTNGDDTSLETFTIQEKLDEGTFSTRGSSSTTVCSGGTTYAMMYEEIDCGYLSQSYGIFSGVSKVHATDMFDGETLTFVITTTIDAGNLEVVIVDPNDDIVATIAVNGTATYTIDNTIDGIYFVVIGGESAEFSIEIDRTIE